MSHETWENGPEVTPEPSPVGSDERVLQRVARLFHRDIISFIRKKHAEGKINDWNLSTFLAAAKPEYDRNEGDYVSANSRVLRMIIDLHPELADDLRQLATTAKDGPEGPSR